jgi:hypothetical protein
MALVRRLFADEPSTKFYKNPTDNSVAGIKLEINITFTLLTLDKLSVETTLLYCITAYGLEA